MKKNYKYFENPYWEAKALAKERDNKSVTLRALKIVWYAIMWPFYLLKFILDALD